VTTIDRAMPAPQADERTTLEGWLDFYRATLVNKVDGLDDEQVRVPAVAPSPLTLLGLVQHMAEVERTWFRRALGGEDVPRIYPDGSERDDGGFTLAPDAGIESARRTWDAEVARSREHCATRELDEVGTHQGLQVSLRWIYSHVIAEYARHAGHADLVRERLDGTTGV
jgi:uncharacterized damage-inducible protein DinB